MVHASAPEGVTQPALHHIVYRSEAVLPVSTAELAALLTVSRGHNRRLDITGLLLFSEERYMQCLEGPGDAVRALYRRIRADPRHRGVTLLLDQPVSQRSFARWDMACSIISSSWWLELARAEWAARVASTEMPPSAGLMLMKSAWYTFGETFETVSP